MRKEGIKMDNNYSNNQQGNVRQTYGQQQQNKPIKQGSGLGIASLVLGILGFLTGIFGIGIFLDVIAIILGVIAIISKKNKKGLAIAGVIISVVSILFVVLFVNVFSDKNKDQVKKVEASTEESVSGETKDIESSKAETNDIIEVSETVESYNVGDIVEGKYSKITYISCTDYDSGNEFIQPKDGNKYIQLEFEFENIGDSDQFVSTFEFNGYADGYTVEKAYTDTDLSATLSSGKKTKGTVTVEVPIDAKEIIVEYEENAFIGGKTIFNVE